MATKTAKSINKKTLKTNTRTSPVQKISITKPLSKFNIKKLALPAFIILTVLILGFLKNQFVSAIVNGEQITRFELIRELEKSDGQRILQNLITEKLIKQEAKKRNITVTEEEIDAEIAKIEESVTAQGQSLDNLLAIQNFTREQLKEQLRNQLIIQKMVSKETLEVTDEELNKYIEENQESFPEETDVDAIKENIREQLKQQKLNTQMQSLLTQLEQEAKIDILLR